MVAITRNLGTTIGTALMGTICAASVMAAHGGPLTSGATAAPVEAQVAGLQSTFVLVAFVMLIPLALSLWEWWRDR